MNILIVDDEIKNIKLLDVLLGSAYNFFKALDGISAMEILKKEKVDLILLDIMMPDVNGYQLCTQVKNDPALKEIPIIMLTSLSDEESQLKALKLGAVDYVTKPFKIEILTARINTHLELKRSRDELQNTLKEKELLIHELTDALANIKTLRSLLPICSSCKKIRDDKGYWCQLDAYLMQHTDLQISHSICPDCAKKLYPDLDLTGIATN